VLFVKQDRRALDSNAIIAAAGAKITYDHTTQENAETTDDQASSGPVPDCAAGALSRRLRSSAADRHATGVTQRDCHHAGSDAHAIPVSISLAHTQRNEHALTDEDGHAVTHNTTRQSHDAPADSRAHRRSDGHADPPDGHAGAALAAQHNGG
jgi:hypothetical protein